jgi:hypothetical protein
MTLVPEDAGDSAGQHRRITYNHSHHDSSKCVENLDALIFMMDGETGRATKPNAGKDDLVRGKRRQRRKAQKTKSGCVTCK